MGVTPQPLLVSKGLEKSRAIPLFTLRACVVYKRVKFAIRRVPGKIFGHKRVGVTWEWRKICKDEAFIVIILTN